MTYLTVKYIKGNPYLYEVRSEREGDRVRQVFVRYLGRADKAENIGRRTVGREAPVSIEPKVTTATVEPVVITPSIEPEKIIPEVTPEVTPKIKAEKVKEPWQMSATSKEYADLTIGELDRAAFGFAREDITTLNPEQLGIKWRADFDDVIETQKNSGLTKKEWAETINLSEPIDVIYEGGKFLIDDGYHRYYAASILNKPLNVSLEIKDKPHKAIVEKALSEGKPVPAEVLATYPDLAPAIPEPVVAPKVPVAEEGRYLYHGTTQGALRKILSEGIKPTAMGQVSLSSTEQYAETYAERKSGTRGILLRIRDEGQFIPDKKITEAGDFLTKEIIRPEDIEVKMPDGSWSSLVDVEAPIGVPELKAQPPSTPEPVVEPTIRNDDVKNAYDKAMQSLPEDIRSTIDNVVRIGTADLEGRGGNVVEGKGRLVDIVVDKSEPDLVGTVRHELLHAYFIKHPEKLTDKGFFGVENSIRNLERGFALPKPPVTPEPVVTPKVKPPRSELDEMLSEKHPQVDAFVYERPDSIRLQSINVSKELQRGGLGTDYIQDLVDYADEVEKTITLSTGGRGFDFPKAKLIAYYKRFGFVENKGRNLDLRISDTMYRKPAAIPKAEVAPPVTPEVTPLVELGEVKEPWEMTKEEYVKPPYTSPAMHKFGVEKALKEGKPVPSEVLAEYPDLKPQVTPTEPVVTPTPTLPVTARKIEIKYVESKKDLPGDYGNIYEAVSDVKKGIIYITKNASKGTLEHEKYHMIKNHPNKPKYPTDYLRQELEAEFYAYGETGYPRQIKGRLIGFANDIMWRRYNNSPEETVNIIDNAFNNMSLPDRWIKDWDVIKSRITKLDGIKVVEEEVVPEAVTLEVIATPKEPKKRTEIPYSRDLDIRNVEALPRGTGAKYLLTLKGQGDELIAKKWARVKPKSLLPDEVLIEMPPPKAKTESTTVKGFALEVALAPQVGKLPQKSGATSKLGGA